MIEFVIQAVDGTLIEWSFFNEVKLENTNVNPPTNSDFGNFLFKQTTDQQEQFQLLKETILRKQTALIHNALFFKRSAIKINTYSPQEITPLISKFTHLERQSKDREGMVSGLSSRVGTKLKEYTISSIELPTLLKLRVKEGFEIHELNLAELEGIKSVELKLKFRPHIEIDYVVKVLSSTEHTDELDKKTLKELLKRDDDSPYVVRTGQTVKVSIYLNATKGFRDRYFAFVKEYKVGSNIYRSNLKAILADYIESIYVSDTVAAEYHKLAYSGTYSAFSLPDSFASLLKY